MTKAPTRSELNDVLDKSIIRITKLLEKRGIIRRDEDDHLQINLDEDDALARLQAGAATYRFTLSPNKGKKALTLKTVPENDHTSTSGLVAINSGFSLHAGFAMAGNEREKIEKLCRYIPRPAIALDRLSLNQRGQVIYTLKKPYSDGTTHIVMTPIELLERLAAIVPRPRVHLTRFAGVFAPHFMYRSMVVPKPMQPAPPYFTPLGQTSANIQSVFLWCVGSDPVTAVGSPKLVGPSDFSITSENCGPGTFAKQGYCCQVHVSFSPSVLGFESAAIYQMEKPVGMRCADVAGWGGLVFSISKPQTINQNGIHTETVEVDLQSIGGQSSGTFQLAALDPSLKVLSHSPSYPVS